MTDVVEQTILTPFFSFVILVQFCLALSKRITTFCYILTFESMLIVDFKTGYCTCVLGFARERRNKSQESSVKEKCVVVQKIFRTQRIRRPESESNQQVDMSAWSRAGVPLVENCSVSKLPSKKQEEIWLECLCLQVVNHSSPLSLSFSHTLSLSITLSHTHSHYDVSNKGADIFKNKSCCSFILRVYDSLTCRRVRNVFLEKLFQVTSYYRLGC